MSSTIFPRRLSVPRQLDMLHNCDCVTGMQQLDEGLVDLAFADPPFNIGYEYDVYDDRLESEKYLDWCRQWTAEVVRVLKPNGTFWLAIGDEYAAELKVMLQREHGLTCRSWVVWYYTFGVNCKYKFSRSHAHLFHMVKDPKQLHVQRRRDPRPLGPAIGLRRRPGEPRRPAARRHLDPSAARLAGGISGRTRTPGIFPASAARSRSGPAGTAARCPNNCWAGSSAACSNEGDLVLDPFGGSGTTLAVAKKLGRRFVGFELSKEYSERIRQRLPPDRAGRPA